MGKTNAKGIKISLLNARSVVHKTANVHNTICDHKLDLLALNETWHKAGAPDAVNNAVAPPGYRVLYSPEGGQGRGLAVVYRSELKIVVVPPTSAIVSCELQLLRFAIGGTRFLLANVYRTHDHSIDVFVDELADVLDSMLLIGGHILLAGDMNCPGDTPTTIDHRLAALLARYNLQPVHEGPTRLDPATGRWSRLDVIAKPENCRRLSLATIASVSYSDHCLLTAVAKTCGHLPHKVTYSFRDVTRLDMPEFRRQLIETASFGSPSDDPDQFTDQLAHDMRQLLDKLAPVRHRTRRVGTNDCRWLSSAAKSAKRERRQLERRFKKTRSSTDRLAFRAACRKTTKLIVESRAEFIRATVTSAAETGPRRLWLEANKLLNPVNLTNDFGTVELQNLVNRFSTFFCDKLINIGHNIGHNIAIA